MRTINKIKNEVKNKLILLYGNVERVKK